MGMFKTNRNHTDENIERSVYKEILGVLTGSFWIIGAILLLIDAFASALPKTISGQILSSSTVLPYVEKLIAPIFNQTNFIIHLISFILSILGISAVIIVVVSLRSKTNLEKWKKILIAGMFSLFLFSLTNTILKLVYFNINLSILALITCISSLAAVILFFTILNKDELKAGIILVTVPMAYLGGTIGSLLVLLFLITKFYGLIS